MKEGREGGRALLREAASSLRLKKQSPRAESRGKGSQRGGGQRGRAQTQVAEGPWCPGHTHTQAHRPNESEPGGSVTVYPGQLLQTLTWFRMEEFSRRVADQSGGWGVAFPKSSPACLLHSVPPGVWP